MATLRNTVSYNEEVLIRQKPGGPHLPVRLLRYLDEHRDKTELLSRLGRSVVRVTDDSEEDNGGSGFLAKLCLANKGEFYALITNEHIIGIDFIRGGSGFYICSELLQERYEVNLSTCPFAFCSPRKIFPEDGERIKNSLSSNIEPLTFPIIAKYEGDGPYLDVTVIELNDKLVDQIGKENFIVIDALQHNTRAVQGDKIFVLEYPSFKNAVPGTKRFLCISTGVAGHLEDHLEDQYSHYAFKHTADTQIKASGSPVLRWNGTVCGVHRAGETRDDESGKPDDYNLAARMDVLLERLEAVRSQKS